MRLTGIGTAFVVAVEVKSERRNSARKHVLLINQSRDLD